MTTVDLQTALAGLPILSVAIGANPTKQAAGPYTTMRSADSVTIGIDWSDSPTTAQQQQAASIISTLNVNTPTAAEQTAAVAVPAITMQALCAAVAALSAGQSVPGWASALIGPVATAANAVNPATSPVTPG